MRAPLECKAPKARAFHFESNPIKGSDGNLSRGETHARSVLKAVSWRVIGTIDTFVISWLLTGKLTLAGSIAGLELVTKLGWYYFHERLWAAISWGRS